MKKTVKKTIKTVKKVTKKTVKNDKAPIVNVTAEISIFGKKYIGEGENLNDAITRLQPQGFTKTRTVLVVDNNGVRREKILTPIMTYRLFSPQKLMREIALKNIISYFK